LTGDKLYKYMNYASFMNTVMSLRVPWRAKNFLSEWLLASQEGQYPMELQR